VSTKSANQHKTSRLAPGQAPPVAAVNAAAARENIGRKLAVYSDWANFLSAAVQEHAPPPFPIDGLPLSQNGFNEWTSESLNEASLTVYKAFSRNSNATLNNNEDLRDQFLAFAKLIKAAIRAKPEKRRAESLAALRRQLSLAQAVLTIAERELARTRVELKEARDKYETQEAELRSSENKAAEEIAERDLRLAELSRENAQLARSLRNIAPLTKASK
jgi:hypothetical protein